MKRVMLAAAVASVLLGSSPSPAAADSAGAYVYSAEVNNLLARGCDEYIRFSGTTRFVSASASWDGFDTFASAVRIVDANLVGVGETTGTTYRLVEIIGGTAMEREDQVVSGTQEIMVKIFGGGQIYRFTLLAHLTVALNGEVTAAFGDMRQDGCSA